MCVLYVDTSVPTLVDSWGVLQAIGYASGLAIFSPRFASAVWLPLCAFRCLERCVRDDCRSLPNDKGIRFACPRILELCV